MLLAPRCVPFALLLAAAPGQVTAAVKPGSAAPEIQFEVVLNAPAPIAALSDLRGSAVLLEFWATWCGPSRAQIPHMAELQKQYADRGLVVLGLAMGEARAVVEPFVAANAIGYPIGVDSGGATKAFGIAGIPYAFLIDAHGDVIWAGLAATVAAADVERALVGALPFGAALTDQLEPVQMLLGQFRKGRAEALLLVLQKSGKLEPRAAELAAATLLRLQREAQRGLAKAAALAKDGQRVGAALQWAQIEDEFDGRDAARQAAGQLAVLEQTDDGKRAVGLARRLGAAQVLARAGKLEQAEAEYKSLVKVGDAEASKLAESELAFVLARRARNEASSEARGDKGR